MQRWVSNEIVAVAHGITDLRDGVTGRTGQPNMGFGRIKELPYWGIHHAIEQQGHVVAAGAPTARPGTDDILHVFNRFAIPLVIERRKSMRRLRPLSVNIRMAVSTA